MVVNEMKVWNLRYIAGNTNFIFTAADSPMSRKKALEGFNTIAKYGWAVWVEDSFTGELIAESEAEKQRQLDMLEGAV